MANQDIVPLDFSVVECSSEDDEHGCSNLQEYREDGVGWLSERGCKYPQTLVLKVHHQDDHRFIQRLDIRCHESKIPANIEISLGDRCHQLDDPESIEACKSVERLGCIILDSNQRTGYRSRELKSTLIQKEADFIKLDLMECYKNVHNVGGQVGIVGIRVMGCRRRNSSLKSPITSEITPGTDDLPVAKIEIPKISLASLPLSVKNDLDPKIQNSVDRLERFKKERAALEDFDTAAKIKDSLGQVYSALVEFKESENMMRDAAAREDYAQASKLKLERNAKRDAAVRKLTEVEEKWVGREAKDLSISTINDESFVSRRSAQSTQHFGGHDRSESEHNTTATLDQLKPLSPIERCESVDEYSTNADDENDSTDSERDSHPLAGVEGAEELPAPEALNAESAKVSSDFFQKVVDIYGMYRANCFFSKNWMLREAALSKMSLLSKEIYKSESEAENCAQVLCDVILRSIDDKNVQVYLAGLILLDDSMTRFEEIGFPSQKLGSLMSKIIINLLAKLADSKQKVADSAELSLLSLAHSSCIDISILYYAATKRIRSEEAKGGRTCKARIQFLENLIAEFGNNVSWERAIEFTKSSKAFDHRDSGVRDAAKSLVLTLMMVRGEKVLRSLENCDEISERQLNEFRTKFAIIHQTNDESLFRNR